MADGDVDAALQLCTGVLVLNRIVQQISNKLRRGGAKLGTEVRLFKAQRIAAGLAACGDWKNRPEWIGKSSGQIATE